MNEAVEESRQSSACPAALIRHSWRLSKIRIVTGGSKVGMVESRSEQVDQLSKCLETGWSSEIGLVRRATFASVWTTGWRGRLQRAANRHRRAAHCITSADAGSANVVAGFLLAAQHLAQLLSSSRSFVRWGMHWPCIGVPRERQTRTFRQELSFFGISKIGGYWAGLF